MSAPEGPSNAAHVLNLAPPANHPMTSLTPSPPRSISIKPSSPQSQSYPAPSAQDIQNTDLSPNTDPNKSSLEGRDHSMVSPPPPPKLPEAPVSPKSLVVSSSATAAQAPAQLALMLSNALSDVEALKKSLAEEKRRAARAERLLQSFHPNVENGVSDEQKKETLPANALQAAIDAESRAERAERARDDALHALHSLTAHFAELERYESSLSLRASDVRGAFTRLLTRITTSHPPPVPSPTLTGSPPTLTLPALPAPLQAPSLTAAASQYLPGAQPPPPSSSRHTRALPAHATNSFDYLSHGASHSRQSSHQHASQFSGLPLPPPPSASGLGSGLLSAPPPSSSTSFSAPAKRSHRSRSTRALDSAADPGTWDDAKRRRVGPWDMDVDESHLSHAEQPLPYPQHQPPLSAQPTQRIYDRDRERVQPQQSYARNGADANGVVPMNANGMVRVDARDLVRDAKERERRERDLYQRKDTEASRRRRRSVSRSSAGSSWSIDEMLLETATDGGRERREDGRPSPVGISHDHTGPGPVHPIGVPQPYPSGQTRDEQSRKVGSHSSQPSNGSVVGANGFASTEREKTGKVPASNLMTLGPGGVVVSGGGQAVAPLPGGGFPAYNAAGQRICRQCGVPGRYKEGKCVEKWGPGPEGPGTVCDRCRKKMKRVERRGTIDGAMAAAQHQAFLAQQQSQAQLQVQPTLPLAASHGQPANRSRTSLRSDTLLLDPHSQSQTQSTTRSLSQQHAYSHERGRGRPRDQRSQGGSSRSHSPAPAHQPSGTVRQGQTYSHNQSQGGRRAPSPPYINSISTREQENEGDGDQDAEENDRDSVDVDVDAELARAAEGGTTLGKSRETSRSIAFSSSSSLSSNASLRATNGTTMQQPRSSSRASASSTNTAYEQRRGMKSSKSAANGATNAKIMPLPNVTTLQGGPRHRDTLDELDEDEGDADAEVDGSGDGDPDAEIMDAVDATMKVEE